MTDEPRKDEEIEVEGHSTRAGVQEEPREEAEAETDFEAHVRRAANVRMDSPSNS